LATKKCNAAVWTPLEKSNNQLSTFVSPTLLPIT
jgi:hypothetical protein